jgi:tetratricopeptide (TPR) repeat protein
MTNEQRPIEGDVDTGESRSVRHGFLSYRIAGILPIWGVLAASLFVCLAVVVYMTIVISSYISHLQAIAELRGIFEQDPRFACAYNDQGVAYSNQGQYQQAIAYFNKAIELDPDFAGAYGNRGNAYARMGQHERAIADYDKAIELDPDYAIAYCNRGFAYADLDQYEQAIADFEMYLKLHPDAKDRAEVEQKIRELKGE